MSTCTVTHLYCFFFLRYRCIFPWVKSISSWEVWNILRGPVYMTTWACTNKLSYLPTVCPCCMTSTLEVIIVVRTNLRRVRAIYLSLIAINWLQINLLAFVSTTFFRKFWTKGELSTLSYFKYNLWYLVNANGKQWITTIVANATMMETSQFVLIYHPHHHF